MERYFESTDFIEDARPEYHYQVGVTPERKERARNHCARVAALEKRFGPVSLCPPEVDKKSRFFWRVGERPVVSSSQGCKVRREREDSRVDGWMTVCSIDNLVSRVKRGTGGPQEIS